MTPPVFTCPQCLFSSPREAGLKFCPRCGLADSAAADDIAPLRLGADLTVLVGSRLAFGDIANLYRCTVESTGLHGVLKIARTPPANVHIVREAQMLVRLKQADLGCQAGPFLPRNVLSLSHAAEGEDTPRMASVLAYHPEISGPDELYSLEEVHAAYPNGIDARDMAWIWRRVLNILTYVHSQQMVHGAMTPDHILIEPREHKLVLIGWCSAVFLGGPPILKSARWRGWSSWNQWSGGASPAIDIASAARSMSYLLPEEVEPAIARHLERAVESASDAGKLLNDFDRMIEGLWGPRQFREFKMPARSA